MSKHRGTTASAAKFFVAESKGSRPATSGNKNLGSSAQMPGGSQSVRVDGVIAANLKGPDPFGK